MNDIVIPISLVIKHGLKVNDYLVLYNIANNYSISELISNPFESIIELESKGFLRISKGTLVLRDKSKVFFSFEEDLFLTWLNIYPTRVKAKFGNTRALSPASPDTMLGKKLRNKWNSVFKNKIEAQRDAIKVLSSMIKDKEKSGQLEYMVEAHRWLNEGYHEKYSFLLDDDNDSDVNYTSEDYA